MRFGSCVWRPTVNFCWNCRLATGRPVPGIRQMGFLLPIIFIYIHVGLISKWAARKVDDLAFDNVDSVRPAAGGRRFRHYASRGPTCPGSPLWA